MPASIVNTTVNTASTTYTNKTFYDKVLLAIAKTKMVHAQFGQKRTIPKNSGKSVEFRKYNLFTPSTTSLILSEGVTPSGQALGRPKWTRLSRRTARLSRFPTCSA